MKGYLLAALGLVGFLAFRKVNRLKAIDVSIRNLALTGLEGWSDVRAILKVELNNPSNESLKVDRLFLNVYKGGQIISTIEKFGFSIDPLKVTVQDFPTVIKGVNLVSSTKLDDIAKGISGLKVSGTAIVGGTSFPISQELAPVTVPSYIQAIIKRFF